MSTTTISGTSTVSISTATDASSAFIVVSGGTLDVVSGGVVSGLITLSNGGTVSVGSSGSTLSTIISSGGSAVLSAGGSTEFTSVSAGGKEFVYGADTSATIVSGGSATVFAGGIASDTSIGFGGQLTVSSGGEAISAQATSGVSGSFNLVISSGGSSLATSVTNGGVEEVFSGGVTTGALVSASGFTSNTSAVEVLSGGTASGAIVSGTGKLIVRNGGVAVSAAVAGTGFGSGSNGGVNVSSGGIASGTTLNSRGTEVIFSGGKAFGTIINSAGSAFVSSGGAEISAAVNFKGTLVVFSGGTTTATTVYASGTEIVSAGGIASTTTINGGTLELQVGGSAGGTVTFAGPGGSLKIDGTAMPSDTISGFVVGGDTIDLAGISYTSTGSATLLANNQLQVTEGSSTVVLNLNSSQDFSHNSFLLNRDGSGGTVVTLGNTAPTPGTFVYAINGTFPTSGPPGIVVSTEQNGTWSDRIAITIAGVVDPTAVDPNINVLPNGEYLLTYRYVPSVGNNEIYTAVSTDGINFSDARAAFNNSNNNFVSDPTVVELTNGTFLMGVSTNFSTTVFYTSNDGRTYAPTGVTLDNVAVGDFLLLPNGNIRLFYPPPNNPTPDGIHSQLSTDGGQTWTVEPGVRLSGPYADPSVIQTAPGQWEMVAKSVIDPNKPSIPSNHQESLATSTDGYSFTITQSDFLLQASVGEILLDPPLVVVADGTAEITSAAAQTYLVGTSGILQIDSGGSVSGTTISNGGIETVNAGGTDVAAVVLAGGTQEIFGTASATTVEAGSQIVESGGLASGTVISAGVMELASGGTAGGAITFAGSGGTLKIDGTAMPGNTISGFVSGDKIDLAGVAYDSNGSATLDASHVLHVSAGGHVYDLQLDPNQDFSGATFPLTPDHHDGTDVICFMPGTLIRTPAGDIAVESLRRGDLVIVADGRAVPVRWIGRQTVSTRFGDPLRVLPIRIMAGALDDHVPCRDLLVSPDHAVLVDDLLIQAGALVNGTSIVRERNVPERFTYRHVELDDHALVLAENTPAETFVDNIGRLAFDNWAEHEALYSDGRAIVELPYPRAKAARQLPHIIRTRLAVRGRKLYGGGTTRVA